MVKSNMCIIKIIHNMIMKDEIQYAQCNLVYQEKANGQGHVLMKRSTVEGKTWPQRNFV